MRGIAEQGAVAWQALREGVGAGVRLGCRLERGWSIAALCRLVGCCLHPNPPPSDSAGAAPGLFNAPWTGNSCLPSMAAAGKCNLGFSFQALRWLKLIMSFKGGGREQSRSHQSEDFELGVTGGAYLWPGGTGVDATPLLLFLLVVRTGNGKS